MFYSQPNKAVPGGCVIALLGFLPIAFGFLLGWAVWRGYQVPPDERPEKWLSRILQLGGGSLICVLLGVIIIYFGMRLAMGADTTNPFSQLRSKMRF